MSPSMPSGGYLDEGDWLAVCELCRERDLFLIYDSAMERLLFENRPLVHPLRMQEMAKRTVVVGSLSKEHRMIGWRVGWVAGPADTVTDAGWAHVYNTTMPVAISDRWGDEVASPYARFVYSAEPVERLETIPDRVSGTRLAEAVASRV